MRRATISVPATSANLGPGYDCLGLALSLRHTVHFSASTRPGLSISAAGEDSDLIPRDSSNLVYRAMQVVFGRFGEQPVGLQIHQENEIPVASGLGSSSSAVVAGMFGANALLGSPLDTGQLLQMATDFEGHPDNVAPAVYGGLVLGVQGPEGLLVERIPLPDLRVVVILPDVAFLTEAARAVVPPVVPLHDAIFNSSRTALLVRALETADYGRLAVAMEDRLHQPYRVPLIPGMEEAMSAALQAGAAGVALSGAGPSLIAFAEDGHDAVGAAAAAAFAAAGLESRRWILSAANRGICVEITS